MPRIRLTAQIVTSTSSSGISQGDQGTKAASEAQAASRYSPGGGGSNSGCATYLKLYNDGTYVAGISKQGAVWRGVQYQRIFDWSGLNVAHIRPTYFAEWLLYIAPMIKAGLLHVPFGTGKHAPIAAEDQGRVIAGILENPAAHRGKVYPLYGPIEVTYEQTAAILTKVLGKPVQYKQIDFASFRKIMESSGRNVSDSNDFLFQHLQEVVIDHQNGIFAGTNDVVEKIGGRSPMTLEAFIEKNRKAFE